MSQLEPAVERRKLAGDCAQQRRLAGAVRSDQPDAHAASRLQALDADDGLARIPGHQPLHAHDHVARACVRAADDAVECQHALLAARRSRLGVNLERLEARLVLMHLRELAMAPIALDELTLTLDRLGARVDVLARPRVALLALPRVGRVIAAKDSQPSIADLPDAVDSTVEERPVMGCHQKRPGPGGKGLLEPLDRGQVEMVGRLVEHEQVELGDEQAGQRGARLLAARHLRRWAIPVGAIETES